MDYSKDLLKEKKKSRFALGLSILFYLLAIAWIPIQLIDEDTISVFDWFYVFVMFFNGLSQTMGALGYSVDRLIGKAFVKIDDQVINIKTGAFAKEQSIEWSQISSIYYQPGNFTITKTDNSTCTLTLSKLEYSVIQEIKSVIENMANDKKIRTNSN